MNLSAPKVTVQKSAEELYKFLSDVKNFESLMPESISKFEVINETSFLFALKGLPEITLKQTETSPYSKLVYGAANGKINFSLTGLITAIDNTSCEVQLNFKGDFNPMMAMLIKGPISKFIETLAKKLPKAV